MNNAEHKWDIRFLDLAKLAASWSKDPSTKVGAVIVGPDGEIRSAGFNGFPRGIADTEERLTNREEKLNLVVHAEMNAVLNAARFGVQLKGCTMYVVATDQSGMVWGGPPCTRCTVEVIQSGIFTIVSYPKKSAPSRWQNSLAVAEGLLEEAGVKFVEVPVPEPQYKFLIPDFLELMNDIGRYGEEKYGAESFHQRMKAGDTSRGELERTQAQTIANHAFRHFYDYLSFTPHDHFGTDKHQLAAVAFNAMLEFYFSQHEQR